MNQRLGLTMLIFTLLVALLPAQDDAPPNKAAPKKDEAKNGDELRPFRKLEKREPPPPTEGKDDPQRVQKIVERLNKNMDSSEERLGKKDPGEDTRKVQEEIIKDLDELIKQAGKGGGGGGGGGGGASSSGARARAKGAVAGTPTRSLTRVMPTTTRKSRRGVPRPRTRAVLRKRIRGTRRARVTPARMARGATAWAATRTPRKTKIRSTIYSRTCGATCLKINARKWTPTPRNVSWENMRQSYGNIIGRSQSKVAAREIEP